jgi:hypothetical protein
MAMATSNRPADQCLAKFNDWLAQMTDDDFRSPDMQRGGQLNRTEIAKQCDIVTSTLRSNPGIKNVLAVLEEDLRTRGILAQVVGMSEQREQVGGRSSDAEKIRRLESDVAQLQAQLHNYKKLISRYELSERKMMEDAKRHR